MSGEGERGRGGGGGGRGWAFVGQRRRVSSGRRPYLKRSTRGSIYHKLAAYQRHLEFVVEKTEVSHMGLRGAGEEGRVRASGMQGKVPESCLHGVHVVLNSELTSTD